MKNFKLEKDLENSTSNEKSNFVAKGWNFMVCFEFKHKFVSKYVRKTKKQSKSLKFYKKFGIKKRI